jgi:hypothetical protein
VVRVVVDIQTPWMFGRRAAMIVTSRRGTVWIVAWYDPAIMKKLFFSRVVAEVRMTICNMRISSIEISSRRQSIRVREWKISGK